MASSTFSDIPSLVNERNSLNNTLIIIVNNDGTLSVDQETLHNLLAEQENTSTTAVRLIRLGVAPDDCSPNSTDSDDSNSSHVNITVEGYYPPNMGQTYQHNDDVDPFLSMDPEEMERLESALQSDQAKQILGEDVTAMLDILTVDDVMTSSQLSDSIKMDHCYTNRLPSSDPLETVNHHSQYTPNVETHARSTSLQGQTSAKATGRLRKEPVTRNVRTTTNPAGNLVMVQQIKSINPPLPRISSPLVRNVSTSKIATLSSRVSAPLSVGKDSFPASESILKKNNIATSVPRQPVLPLSITEEMLNEKLQEIQRSTDDYTNLSGDDQEDKSNSSAEPTVDMEECVDTKIHSSSVGRTLLPSTKKIVGKGIAQKGRSVETVKKVGIKSIDGETTRKLNEDSAKIVPAVKSTHKLKTEVSSNKGLKKPGINPLKVYKIPMKLNQDLQTKQSILEDAKQSEEKIPHPASPQVMKKNYPKRENRKPPAHLLEVFNGPALFSVPDVPRRVSLDNKIIDTRRELDKSVMSSSESTMTGGMLSHENVYFEAENILSTSGEEYVIAEMAAQHHELNPVQTALGRSEHKRRSSSSLETENRSKSGTAGRRKSDEKSASSVHLSTELVDSNDGITEPTYDSLTTEDDPNKLWCICNKPHNNRFMICCDLCEDWFHGVCVGITKALGKAMEEKGNEWTCPNCKKKKGKDDPNIILSSKQTKITTFMNKPAKLGDSPESVTHEIPAAVESSTSAVMFCIVCKKEARTNSIYCSDSCILKHAQNSGSPTTTKPLLVTPPPKPLPAQSVGLQLKPVTSKQQIGVKKVVSLVPNAAQTGSLKAWLKVNPTIKVIQTGATSVPVPGHHVLVLKSSQATVAKSKQAQMIAPKPMLPSVPKVQGKQTLPVQIVDPGPKLQVTKQELVVSGSSVKVAAATSGIKEKGLVSMKVDGKRVSNAETPKKEEKKHSGTDPVRENVRKTLHELLLARIQECDNLKSIPDEKVKKMALHIEEELYGFFKDTGMKYKSKYRSLVFNIKDPKNLTLFRKIAEKSITPHQLVRLSPEELASQELAQWREREAKHELEMIKKNEIDLLALSKTYVMKTHKGEQVIETEDGAKNDVSQLEHVDSLEVVSNQNSVTSTVSDVSLGIQEKQKDGKKDKSKSSDSKRSRGHKSRKERNKKKESRSHSKSSHSRGKHHSKSHGSSRKHVISSEGQGEKVKIIKELDVKHNIDTVFRDTESDVGDERVNTPVMDETAINEVILGKVSEDVDADLEPTSTVTIKSPDISIPEETSIHTGITTTVWKGWAEMYDVAKFFTTIQVVSGDSQTHCESLPPQLSIVGRITPELVWTHVSNMKKTGSYEIMVVRLTASNEDEKIPYVTLYSYLNTRNRLGVVGIKGHVGPVSPIIKDFYILPLSNHSPVPQVLLPLHGPGLEDNRPHLLLGIIVARITKKRVAPVPIYTAKIPRLVDTFDANVSAVGRSYTPPLPDDEPTLSSTAISTRKEESLYGSVINPQEDRVVKKSHDEELSAIKARVTSLLDEEGDEPYSPGESEETEDLLSTPSNPMELARKMEELNRQIAEQQLEIDTINCAIVGDTPAVIPGLGLNPLTSFLTIEPNVDIDENEAYSPSASITPPLRSDIPLSVKDSKSSIPSVSKNIALPSNLQEILANIKKQSDTKMDLKSDPIVQSYSARKEEEREKNMVKKPVVYIPSTIKSSIENSTPSLPTIEATSKFQEPAKSQSTLSKLSDAELIEKAAAMERELIAVPIVNVSKPLSVSLIKKAPVKYALQGENQSDPAKSAPLMDIPMPPVNLVQVQPPLPPNVYNVPAQKDYPPQSPPTIPLLLPSRYASRPYGVTSVNAPPLPNTGNPVSYGKKDYKRKYEGSDQSGKKNSFQHQGGYSK